MLDDLREGPEKQVKNPRVIQVSPRVFGTLVFGQYSCSVRCPTRVTDLQTGPVFLLIHLGHTVALLGIDVKLFTSGKRTP